MSYLQQTAVKKQEEEKNILYSNEQVKEWFNVKYSNKVLLNLLILGLDGTGKSGIAVDLLSEQDIKEGKKIVIIDLDGGNLPIIETYHKNKINNIICINPLLTCETNEGTEIDYKRTFAKIRAVVRYIEQNYQQEKIKAIIFDGLSTALKYAELNMRMEKHLLPDQGVSMLYWKNRNKLF